MSSNMFMNYSLCNLADFSQNEVHDSGTRSEASLYVSEHIRHQLTQPRDNWAQTS